MGENRTGATAPSPRARTPFEQIDGVEADALAAQLRERGNAAFADVPPLSALPYAGALGMRLLALSDGESFLAAPYDAATVGDPETGVIHGGVVTALLDTAAGVAAAKGAQNAAGVATLDLRIDYMRSATPGRALFAKARLYRRTRSITFVRATAYEDVEDRPVAVAIGAFMTGGKVDRGNEA